MATSISLLVQGDEKLKTQELAIISKLMNKRLAVELDDSDLKPDDSIANYKRVETLILKEIKDAAPALRGAKKLTLEKVSSIKKAGWIEVAVSGATAKTFRVHLELALPAKSDPTKRVGYKPDKNEENEKGEKEKEEKGAKKKIPKAPPLKQMPTHFSKLYLAVAKKHDETPEPKLSAALLRLDKNKDAVKTKGLLTLATKLLLKDQADLKARFGHETDKAKKLAMSKYMFDLRKFGQAITKFQTDRVAAAKKHAPKV